MRRQSSETPCLCNEALQASRTTSPIRDPQHIVQPSLRTAGRRERGRVPVLKSVELYKLKKTTKPTVADEIPKPKRWSRSKKSPILSLLFAIVFSFISGYTISRLLYRPTNNHNRDALLIACAVVFFIFNFQMPLKMRQTGINDLFMRFFENLSKITGRHSVWTSHPPNLNPQSPSNHRSGNSN